MSTAPYVEIWPSPDLALAGMRLADKLTEMSIPAANVPSQAAWASRILGWHPAGSVVVILGDAAIGQEAKKGLARARVHGVRVMFCGSRLAQAASPITDWQVPVPSALPPDLVPFALSEALMGAVADACRTPGPVGPASCQRPWPQVERVFLQGAQEPIPALVLRQENPDDRCPVVIYFPGMHSAKENALPGMPDNPNTVCPKIVSALLNSGYHVVVLDTQAHGERKRAWENPEELIRRSLTGDGPDLLMRTRTDARVIVDGVAGLGLSSRQDVAAVGQSWGGLQAILTMAGDERIRCGVGIMPTLRLTTLRPFAGLAGARRLEEGLPGEHFGPLLAPRPLLLVAGDRDQLAPSEHVRAFADAVEPAYGRTAPVNLRHVTLAGLDHEFDPRQVEVTLGWLNEHLGKDQSPGSTRPGTGLCQGD
jgi:dienelactone hydrolase